ncbi:L,D-transpeptidase family protein [Hymenobacter sp. J193]|uniref:L,D-transpeptidase family protein n=1 Tax=Hymenobacter sp. J193 TaxID=2898429 RepID=UPI0021517CA7|nr:L,D-transpeptidase family protein [Hymenobacter sp. J193]MCR5888889.1 L,D-transpeptidase family protein [Hymenobacter sp. J193]
MRLLIVWAGVLLATCGQPQWSFREDQLQFSRVRAAYQHHGSTVQALFVKHGIDPQRPELFVRAIKTRRQLEVWGRTSGQGSYQLLRAYHIAATSGTLGPKRREGDLQVPEGFYFIDRFNPSSTFHLSLGLNYPNAADRQRSDPQHPGGDIFIHGSNVTIGCLPITDDKIEELYVLLVEARTGGQEQIPVHIFPFDLTPTNLTARAHSPHHSFWRELAPGFRYFEQHRQLPTVDVTAEGSYAVGP